MISAIALYAADNAFAVGAIIRVAHSFLAREIIIIGDSPYYEKASMGMEKYETIVRVKDDEGLLEHTRGRPLWAVEKDHATTSVHAIEQLSEGGRSAVRKRAIRYSRPRWYARADRRARYSDLRREPFPAARHRGWHRHERMGKRRHYASGTSDLATIEGEQLCGACS